MLYFKYTVVQYTTTYCIVSCYTSMTFSCIIIKESDVLRMYLYAPNQFVKTAVFFAVETLECTFIQVVTRITE